MNRRRWTEENQVELDKLKLLHRSSVCDEWYPNSRISVLMKECFQLMNSVRAYRDMNYGDWIDLEFCKIWKTCLPSKVSAERLEAIWTVQVEIARLLTHHHRPKHEAWYHVQSISDLMKELDDSLRRRHESERDVTENFRKLWEKNLPSRVPVQALENSLKLMIQKSIAKEKPRKSELRRKNNELSKDFQSFVSDFLRSRCDIEDLEKLLPSFSKGNSALNCPSWREMHNLLVSNFIQNYPIYNEKFVSKWFRRSRHTPLKYFVENRLKEAGRGGLALQNLVEAAAFAMAEQNVATGGAGVDVMTGGDGSSISNAGEAAAAGVRVPPAAAAATTQPPAPPAPPAAPLHGLVAGGVVAGARGVRPARPIIGPRASAPPAGAPPRSDARAAGDCGVVAGASLRQPDAPLPCGVAGPALPPHPSWPATTPPRGVTAGQAADLPPPPLLLPPPPPAGGLRGVAGFCAADNAYVNEDEMHPLDMVPNDRRLFQRWPLFDFSLLCRNNNQQVTMKAMTRKAPAQMSCTC